MAGAGLHRQGEESSFGKHAGAHDARVLQNLTADHALKAASQGRVPDERRKRE